MAFKVARNGVYGDFRAIERLDAEAGIFRCECVRCGRSKRYRADSLAELPVCSCEPVPETVQVRVSGERDRLKKIVRTLGKRDEGEEGHSLFLPEVEKISALLEEADTEDGVRRFQLATLKMLVDLVPYAERQYRDHSSQSNAYAINALVTQIRELTQDLNADNDRAALVENLLNSVLQPAFLQLAQILIDSMYALRKDIENDIVDDRRKRVNRQIDQTIRDMAAAFQTLFYDVKKRMADAVQS